MVHILILELFIAHQCLEIRQVHGLDLQAMVSERLPPQQGLVQVSHHGPQGNGHHQHKQ